MNKLRGTEYYLRPFIPSLILVLFIFATYFNLFSQSDSNNSSMSISTSSQKFNYPSKLLGRKVICEVILPPNYDSIAPCDLLLMNDGQDFPGMAVQKSLDEMFLAKKLRQVIVVGIHCSSDRINEYGTASALDYKGRGNKAAKYEDFVMTELLPYIHGIVQKKYFERVGFAGCSLGGLSAMDIAWANPERFTVIGAFSPSFWWRSRAYEHGFNEDTDRIMQNIVRTTVREPGRQRFWFQAGTMDETDDRNQNGIIDAIDDIQDMMKELKKQGYKENMDYTYREVEGGKHDVPTWGKIFPEFMLWAFDKK